MLSIQQHQPSTAVVAPAATASGWIALLQEDSAELRSHALQQLLQSVHTLWHEIADALPELEALAEKENNQIAAAVASRVFFHLQESEQALRCAFLAGPVVLLEQQQAEEDALYRDQLVAAALEAYMKAKQEKESTSSSTTAAAASTTVLSFDQLQSMVYRLLEGLCTAGQYKQALGIALEAMECDKVQAILQASATANAVDETKKKHLDLVLYALKVTTSTCSSKTFRLQVLQVIAMELQNHYTDTSHRADVVFDLVLVYQLLKQAEPVAQILQTLLNSSSTTPAQSDSDLLVGLQLCFDLVDSGDAAFVTAVAAQVEHEQARRVLTGGFPAELALSFSYKQSRADRMIMDNLKKALEERSSGSRSSVLHHAAVMAHSYLYAGTTNDSFLRDHLDWMKKASNWAKFSATASLGIIHAGHITEAMQLLQPYLPADPTDGNVSPTGGYAEGGSLYALGLIHGSALSDASKRQETTEFVRTHLRASHTNEVISHGAALGVGLTAMGSADLSIINELKEVLDTDSAVAGEAAGIAIGMVLVGTGAGNTHNNIKSADKESISQVIVELKNYARETQHEKIIRGIAMGLALANFGQEENADAMIEDMRSDRDPIMRYGAMYALSMAYCGTGSNKAIRILLHTAVSDVSDDVRMAAVIGLAFVLFKTPERVPQLVKLLLESFNHHVRYASCMAVGIAMAGTGDAESIALLEPMLDDMTDYVRQGALIGTAMIYMQQSDVCNGRKIRSFRDKIATIVTEKHQSTLTKMGAIIATGILDAGGRNCCLQLGKRGFVKMSSVVGLALWLQHWHWFPMMHMLTLALTPTYTIGLTKDFKYPKNFVLECHTKPSLFAYPKKLEEKKEEKKKRVETVTLSTTAKEKARQARKQRAKMGDSAMDVEEVEEPQQPEVVMEEADEAKKGPKKKQREPDSFTLSNPARMTTVQATYCSCPVQRYRPIRDGVFGGGVMMLTDATPQEEETDLGAIRSPSLEPEGELAPPEPFEWTPPTASDQDLSDD